ncbi:hypothetical protein B0T22DRAFT_8244 [Podospora appendiculata]|uniref:CCHC-type domain-containing protein n=1 Tax=Podospora appendiculata TaxID=314037 RepID=A0AAE1CFA0_9PEZI|nr:hypothetical protein B0T22DRAFT_8244 [Podospora appendiculata]
MAPSTPAAAAADLPSMEKSATPKTMSSRLMTMKFMQRGAVAAATAAATEAAKSPGTPVKEDEDGSASKRRKVADASVPSTPKTPVLYDQKALQAALEEEDKKRKAAIERRAAELGDSHWVLPGAFSTPKNGSRLSLNVVEVGFAQIDYPTAPGASEDVPDVLNLAGKARFRQFNMKKSKSKAKDRKGEDEKSNSSDSNDDDDEDSDSEDQASPAADGSGSGRRASTKEAALKRARPSVPSRRDEERIKAQELAARRRKKDVKLNTLTSISSAGASTFQKPSPPMVCHGCGKSGHIIAKCPRKTH